MCLTFGYGFLKGEFLQLEEIFKEIAIEDTFNDLVMYALTGTQKLHVLASSLENHRRFPPVVVHAVENFFVLLFR